MRSLHGSYSRRLAPQHKNISDEPSMGQTQKCGQLFCYDGGGWTALLRLQLNKRLRAKNRAKARPIEWPDPEFELLAQSRTTAEGQPSHDC